MSTTLAGKPVLLVELIENRSAAWTAIVELEAEEPIAGAVVLDMEGERFAGTVVQSDVSGARVKVLLVGGAGGLQKPLPALHYYQPTLGNVLTDVARESGERCDPAIPATVFGRRLPHWSRLEGEAHMALRQVADELGLQWRITRAGLIWVGEETWPAIAPHYVTTDYSPELRLLTIAYADDDDKPVVAPGMTLDGKRVERVETRLTERQVRQDVFFDDSKGQAGLFTVVAKKIREIVLPKLFLSRFYGARVAGQEVDGSVTILLDDPMVGGKFKGLDHVPLTFGLPGVKVVLPNGSRLRLFWDAGNPSRPRAALFDQDAAAEEITITASTAVKIVGDLLVSGEVIAKAGSEATAIKLSTHLHPTAVGPSGVPLPG
jgi:hypothetical protein